MVIQSVIQRSLTDRSIPFSVKFRSNKKFTTNTGTKLNQAKIIEKNKI